MPKALAVLILALACLITLCTALPFAMPAQTVFAITESNVPRTLLGRLYRRRPEGKSCPRARSTVTLAGCKAAGTDLYPDSNDGSCSQTKTVTKNKTGPRTGTSPKLRATLPLPLVLNTFQGAGSARLRMMRTTRPIPIPCIRGGQVLGQTLFREIGESDIGK